MTSDRIYKVYGGDDCIWCDRAGDLLSSLGEEYIYINVHDYPDALAFIKDQGLRSVPQIFLEDNLIGGFQELKEKLNNDR